jgi:glycine cleavage system H protein
MDIRSDLRYTATHEWVRVEGDLAYVGITDYAQEALGDIVFVERPAMGETFAKGDEVATIESVKAASPLYCPASGSVTQTNAALDATPELINQGAYDAFIFALRLSNRAELASLLDAEGYRAVVEREQQKH